MHSTKTKLCLVSVKHNNIFHIIFIWTTCFGQLTVIKPSLQNLESDACSEDNIHVMWDPEYLLMC